MRYVGKETTEDLHDKCAPFWAAALILFVGLGLSTLTFDFGYFWRGYLLDVVGPAWTYILFRGLFTKKMDNAWTHFFTPARTLAVVIGACLVIETLQYLNVYESTYDPWDLLAYCSLVVPLSVIDWRLVKRSYSPTNESMTKEQPNGKDASRDTTA